MTFQNFCDIILAIRDKEKAENPIELQFEKLGYHIYAVGALQFNILYGNIHERHNTMKEPDLQFWMTDSGIMVLARESDTKKEFRLADSIKRLAEEFTEEPHITEIVDGILRLQPE